MNLKIEYVKTADLVPYANNAKIHTNEQVEQIKRSIQEFGFNDPIAVWRDNEIIEGHGRLIAAKDLGIDEVPVIRLDSLTDEQRRAYTLVHNKLTMNTGFDFELLDLELENIDLDMEQFGFEISEIEPFYENELDSNEVKNTVVVSINCGAVSNYESIKERLQNLTDEINGSMSIKMQ